MGTQDISPDLREWLDLIHDEANVEEVTIHTTTNVFPYAKVAITHQRGSNEITVSRVAT